MSRGRYHRTELLLLQAELPPFASRNDLTCKSPDADPDLWFSRDQTNVDLAQGLCRICPIEAKCAEWAIRTRQPHGVWGGTTRADRIPSRRQRIGQVA